jgi:transcriptional regulator with XRE-family HTH domain
MLTLNPGFGTLLDRLRAEIQRRISVGEWTERALARHAGVSQPHLNQVLKGRKHLSIEMADRLRQTLGLGIADLLKEPDPEPWNDAPSAVIKPGS